MYEYENKENIILKEEEEEKVKKQETKTRKIRKGCQGDNNFLYPFRERREDKDNKNVVSIVI